MAAKHSHNTLWGGWMIALGLVLMAGCGTPQERYRVLSFFFDGVPNPDTVKPTTQEAVVHVVSRVVRQHKPYAENNCVGCHRSASGEIQEFSEAYKQCVKCHPKTAGGQRLMHGPVAQEACRWCHAPHESAEPALFKDAPIKVCTQCHDKQLLGDNPPEHVDGTTSCLECHFGHGGDARYFLKPRTVPASPPDGAATSMPATEPALHLPQESASPSVGPDSAPGREKSP